MKLTEERVRPAPNVAMAAIIVVIAGLGLWLAGCKCEGAARP